MKGLMVLVRAGVVTTVLLASMALVLWRQSRSLEVLARLDEIRQQTSLAQSEIAELERRIQMLESRGRVVEAARSRLGMHAPEGAELVILPGAAD
ncbi:MAG: hypothetical protein OEZ65_02095 [Gemmatimonadota bacterium]|nr:hypothetical protein [Gemmatimonadota bacterium]